MNNKDVKVFNGETLLEKKNVSQNENMMQIRSQYVAAMHVSVPRNEKQIIAKIEQVAKYVGHEFFYLWPVSSKDEKKIEMISGGTIDLAETLLYYWTNIAIEHELKDLGDKWEIKHTFIDFEKGMSRPRTTIVFKPKAAPGGWDKERWERMKLNTAFSYNLRDLVFTVIPRWMKNKIITVAKEAELIKATEELKKGDAVNFFIQIKADYGISQEEMLSFIGETEINRNSYFKAKNILAQLNRGDIKASSIKKEPKEKSRRATEATSKKEEQTTIPKADGSKKSESVFNDAPMEEAAKAATTIRLTQDQNFDQIIKSFDMRGISALEMSNYWGVDIDEMNTPSGIEDLQKMATNIEGGVMSPDKFKQESADRFDERQGK